MAASKQEIKPIAFLVYMACEAQTPKLLMAKKITEADIEPTITGIGPFLLLINNPIAAIAINAV